MNIQKSKSFLFAGILAAIACTPASDAEGDDFTLPDGFRAQVFADDLGYARHIAIRGDGAVYTILRRGGSQGGLVAMKDDDGDGVADRVEFFGRGYNGTGLGFHDGYLYFATTRAVFRYAFEGDELVPAGDPEIVIGGFLRQGQHAEKPFAFDNEGNIYVSVGAPSNACMERTRSKGSPGQRPCPQLERQAGIWKFDANTLGQDQTDGALFATGLRNAIAKTWHGDALYFLSHGRDQLGQFFPEYYDVEANAALPAEEFHVSQGGTNHGWPYTYYDWRKGARMVGPEYGGDGDAVVEPGLYEDPLIGFPGHWAPNDIKFYDADAFPARYRGGAFIAFHGSWNRAPLPQAGYKIVFVPFTDGVPNGGWEVFADGFKGTDILEDPGDAKYRPMGLAIGLEGELYISDSVEGRIWKVTYEGD